MVSRLKGLLAAAGLWLSAADHYVTARLGYPPAAWIISRLAAATRAAYRLGRYGPPSTRTDLAVIVYDGNIIEENHRG
jgi:hypothetical protein